MKYVIVDRDGLEYPIIFSEVMRHDSVVRANTKVVSAGFCRFSVESGKVAVDCWGDSIGLRVKSRPEDAELIMKHHDFRC